MDSGLHSSNGYDRVRLRAAYTSSTRRTFVVTGALCSTSGLPVVLQQISLQTHREFPLILFQ